MTEKSSSGSILERLIGKDRLKRIKDVAARAPVSGKYTRERARRLRPKSDYPAVVIGSGIGGLSAAAHLARSGFKVTVIEQGDKPGGYATSFRRGDFDFEVSLHAAALKDNPQHRILEELGVLDHVEFEKLPEFHRVITPAHDVTFPHADADAYKKILIERFPEEEKGIRSFVDEIVGVSNDVDRLAWKENHFVRLLFPIQYAKLWRVRRKTLEDLLDEHVSNRELRSLLAAIWPYYGLPPSRLSAFFFAVATGNYLANGGHYPRGRSQDISDAFVKIIEQGGGRIRLETRVDEIMVKRGAAIGVVDSTGRQYDARAVVSNASAPTTMLKLLPEGTLTNGFAEKLSTYRPSLSSFVVWLGLDEDITDRVPQAETFITSCHDPETDYAHCLNSDAERASIAVTVYDNIFDGYSPPGKSTVSIMFLCGYQYWKKFEDDYRRARKDDYNAEKERMAEILVKRTEEALIPGLSNMLEEYEVATPLTNIRYTGNPEGAIYGYEQSTANSFLNRLDNRTPVRNLYLASSWGTPGGGICGALRSGQQTFRCLIDDWFREAKATAH